MPLPTPVESGTRRAVQVAPAKHEGSHLSGVAFRGWEFLGHGRGDRVQAVRTALHRAGPDGLVHLHVDDVDHAGHRHGVDSEPWRTALAEVDALVGALLRRLPRGTRIHLTADHGMVDTSPQHTIDLAAHPQLRRLVDEAAGEARALALHAVASEGADEELVQGLTQLLGSGRWCSGAEVLDSGSGWSAPRCRAGRSAAGRSCSLAVVEHRRLSRRPEHPADGHVHGSPTPAEAGCCSTEV